LINVISDLIIFGFFSENCFYIIGGQQDKVLTNKTWIVTPKSKKCTEFEFTEGPPMNIPR
jgi:hypothetical protein